MKVPLKTKLQNRKMSFGSWVTFPCEASVEILARAGFDWLVIDLEHAPLGVVDAARLIRVIDLVGLPAICRVPSVDGAVIKTVLDAGASGLIVPMIETAEQASEVVALAHYPPAGNRGVGLGRAHGYGSSFEEYRASQADAVAVIAMIESLEGVDNVRAIAGTSGIDGLLIGPYDLSGSMGHIGELDCPELVSAKRTVLEAAAENGIACGLHVVHPGEAAVRQAIHDGYSFLALGVDMILLDLAAKSVLEMASTLEPNS